MLEGVSVDLGRTMLPVSRQISLRVEGPYPRGPWNVAVEHERQNSVSPRSPRDTPCCQSCWKVVVSDGCRAPAVRGYRLFEEGREGRRADSGPRPQASVVDGDDVGCDNVSDPGVA